MVDLTGSGPYNKNPDPYLVKTFRIKILQNKTYLSDPYPDTVNQHCVKQKMFQFMSSWKMLNLMLKYLTKIEGGRNVPKMLVRFIRFVKSRGLIDLQKGTFCHRDVRPMGLFIPGTLCPEDESSRAALFRDTLFGDASSGYRTLLCFPFRCLKPITIVSSKLPMLPDGQIFV
jgi:hypothetical protein